MKLLRNHTKGGHLKTVKENNGEKYVEKIMDSNIVYDEDHESEIQVVAKLAMRCLNQNGVKRPSIKEVAEELTSLNKLKGNENYRARQNGEEMEQLLGVEHESSSSSNRENNQNSVEYTTFDISGYNLETSISIN